VDGSATEFTSSDFRVATLASQFNGRRSGALGLDLNVIIVVNDSIVGDLSELGISGGLAREEQRSEENVVPLEGVILLDDTLVDVGNEEQKGQEGKCHTRADRDTGDPVSGLGTETKFRRSLVNNGQCANGAGNQEEEGRGVNSPGNRVDSHVDGGLDEHEDGGTKDSRDEGSHNETREDGTETRALCKNLVSWVPIIKTTISHTVPAPLYTLDTNGSNTNTSDRRDE
jgi:hypothetical protein